MIDGVKVIQLRQIVDERGKIMHMLKRTDEHFIRSARFISPVHGLGWSKVGTFTHA